MIRKYTVQIIGVILVAIGLFYIYYYRSNYQKVVQSPEFDATLFVDAFFNLFFNAIAMYAGIQLCRLQEIGRKLAIIWFSWILFVVITVQFNRYWSEESKMLVSFELKSLILILSVYLFYAAALISLSSYKVIELMSYNESLMHRVGRILSFTVPGLGRALTGNFLVGMVLFACYVFILRMVVTEPDLTKTVFGVVTWSIFSSIDSAEVKKVFEEDETEMITAEGEAEIDRG